jgi:homoserine/homoserine lactone efflux protein
MSLEAYLAFVAASIFLILMPGPNVALIVANSIAHGVRYGLITVAGTSSAMVLQLAVTVAGLSGFLAVLADGFECLRWLGVLYLLIIGIRAWRSQAGDSATTTGNSVSPRQAFLGGFLVSMTNPKTLLFYAAFLPQFVVGNAHPARQLAVLALTFLVIAVMFDSLWAILADRARGLRQGHRRLLNRITGGFLIAAATGLALARRA